MENTNEVFLNINEAADFLRMKPQTLYQYKAAKKIPFHKVGGKLLFSKAELSEWVKQN